MTHYVLNKRNRSLRQLMFEEPFFFTVYRPYLLILLIYNLQESSLFTM